MKVQIEIPGNPGLLSVNRAYKPILRTVGPPGRRRRVPGIAKKSAYLAAQAKVGECAMFAMRNRTMFEGPVVVDVVSHWGKHGPGDCDSPLKGLIDALQGEIFENDSQVIEVRARKSRMSTDPRIVVTVRDAPRPLVERLGWLAVLVPFAASTLSLASLWLS